MLFHRPLSTLCWEKIGMTWHNNVDKNTIIQKGKDQWKKTNAYENPLSVCFEYLEREE
jgi:hypothetical protein